LTKQTPAALSGHWPMSGKKADLKFPIHEFYMFILIYFKFPCLFISTSQPLGWRCIVITWVTWLLQKL